MAARLDALVDVDVEDASLRSVIEGFAKQADVPIVIDVARLADEGLDIDEVRRNLTLQVRGVRLQSALALVLPCDEDWGSPDLACVVEQDGLRITTAIVASQQLRTEVYTVTDIIEREADRFDEQNLAQAITSLIEPTDWEEVGGTGFIQVTPGALVIAHTDAIHRQIALLLEEFRRLAEPRAEEWRSQPVQTVPSLAAEDSPTRRAIERALAVRVTWDWRDAPLKEVLRSISRDLEINTVSPRYDHGFGGDELVTLKLSNVPLATALTLLLTQHDLTWEIAHDCLLVMNEDSQNPPVEVRCYPTASILHRRQGLEYEELASLVTGTIRPSSWDEAGGPGVIEMLPGCLAIRQTARIQAEVSRFLADLEQCLDPIRPPPSPACPEEDRRLREILNLPVTVDWKDVPLAAQLMELLHGLGVKNVLFGWDGQFINEANESVFGNLTFACHELPLRDLLGCMLADCDRGFQVHDGVLLIGDDLDTLTMQVRYYRISGVTQSGIAGPDTDSIVDLITNHADFNSWDEVGGPGTINSIPCGLVILQTPERHGQVAQLLEGLRQTESPDGPDMFYCSQEPDGEWAKLLAEPASIEPFAGDDTVAASLTRLLGQQGLADRLVIDRGGIERHGDELTNEVEVRFPHWLNIADVRHPPSLRSALQHLLAGTDMLWRTGPAGKLWIESDDANSRLQVTRIYRCDWWPPGPGGPSDMDDLEELLTTFANPHNWEAVGGLDTLDIHHPGWLVITAHATRHEEIAQILDCLKAYYLAERDGTPRPADWGVMQRDRGSLAWMAQPVRVPSNDATLEEALQDLFQQTGMFVLTRFFESLPAEAERANQSAIPPPQSPLPLAAALDAVVLGQEIDWFIQDEALVLEYAAEVPYYGTLRFYDERDFEPAGTKTPALLQETLRVLISDEVDESPHGGQGSGNQLWHKYGHLTVVQASRRVHEHLTTLANVSQAEKRRAALAMPLTGPVLSDQAIDDALADSELTVRWRLLLRILWQHEEDAADSLRRPATMRTLAGLLRDPRLCVRQCALRWMGKWEAVWPPFLEELARLANEPALRDDAFAVLKEIGPPAWPLAQLMLQTGNERQMLAALALVPLMTETPLNLDDDLAEALSRPLRTGTRLQLAQMLLELRTKDASLVSMGNVHWTVRNLANMLQETPLPEERIAICKLLGQESRYADFCIPALAEVIVDVSADDSVRVAACDALAAFDQAGLVKQSILTSLQNAQTRPERNVYQPLMNVWKWIVFQADSVEP